MENLIIPKTDSTPSIRLDRQKNHIEFSGDSRPENAKLFYAPVFNWIEDYYNHLYFLENQSSGNINKVTIDFKLEYFNSSSAKYIIDIFRAINKFSIDIPKIEIVFNWFHDADDDDLLDAGKEFVKITGVNLNFVSC